MTEISGLQSYYSNKPAFYLFVIEWMKTIEGLNSNIVLFWLRLPLEMENCEMNHPNHQYNIHLNFVARVDRVKCIFALTHFRSVLEPSAIAIATKCIKQRVARNGLSNRNVKVSLTYTCLKLLSKLYFLKHYSINIIPNYV